MNGMIYFIMDWGVWLDVLWLIFLRKRKIGIDEHMFLIYNHKCTGQEISEDNLIQILW